MSDLAFRPRSATELVDAAVRLVRDNLAACAMIGLVIAVPQLGFSIAQLLVTPEGGSDAAAPPLGLVALPLLSAFVGLLFHAVGDGALLRVLDGGLRGEPVSANDALRRALPRAPGLLATYLLVMVCWSASLLALLLPAVYVGTRLWTAVAASALEARAPFDAIGTAWRRSAGHVRHSLGAIALVLLLYFVFFFGAGLLAGVLLFVGTRAVLVGTAIVQAAAVALLYPVLLALVVVLHYDLRVRGEGYDLARMLDTLDAADGPGVAGGPSPVGARADAWRDARPDALGDARR